MEVAILARFNGRRAFERLDDDRVAQALSGGGDPADNDPAGNESDNNDAEAAADNEAPEAD